MLFKKLWRTMRLYRAQFLSMILMIALGIGVFVGFNMEWYSIERNMFDFFEETGYADYRLISETGFSEVELEKIGQIAGVQEAARYLTVTADVAEREGDSVALAVTTNPAVSGVLVTDGEDYDPQSADGIWLSDHYAAENDLSVGDTLTLTYKSLSLTGRIRGLIKAGEFMVNVRDSSQLMPDYKTYGFAYIAPVFYEKASGADFYPQIHVISGLDKQDFFDAADRALGYTVLALSKDETGSYSAAKGESDEGKTMGSIFPVLFLLIAVLTMVTTMHRLTAKEKTQIGTLKALGFKDRRILRHYTSYAFFVGALGSVLGIALGYLIAWYIMNPNGMMSTYLDLPQWRLVMPWFCYLVLIGILAALTLIGYLSVKQMLRGSAADALRPYVPKRVKPMLIERTRWFHRLSFGTRWNLRDIMRHKARSAMSLIGIVGSMILLVGSLGMSDTMNAFLNLYYDGATHYASRIALSEEADADSRARILKEYDGDWSASVSVQIEDKTVSLDIYDTAHDLVRFPDESAAYTTLRGDGAYICMRLADEFDLEPGDSFSFSPYGTDETYTVRVAGIIRSVSENVVMTPEYADRIGVSYTMDSVYTETEKADIPSDPAIKSVQSKQMIVDSFEVFTQLLDTSVAVLVLAALVLGIVVLYNLGVMSYTERYREMATLKVVGFKDRRIGQLLIEQNLWLSLLGVLLGLPAGIGTLDYLLMALAGEYEMKMTVSIRSIALAILLTVGMSLLVSLMVSRKNKKIDMVEALKGTE